MRSLLMAAIAAVGLSLAHTPAASAQNVISYSHGSTTFYSDPSSGFVFYYPGITNNGNYAGPNVYGPGYTANYPYMYNQLNYGRTYPYYTTYYYSYSPYNGYRWRQW